MGRRGPPKKNRELVEFEGNTAHRKADETTDAHSALSGVPEPAKYMEELAAAIFSDVAGMLFAARRLTDADIHAIEQYSDAFAQWIHAIRRRDLHAAENGGDPLHKDVKLCRELASDCNRWSRVLGVGPTYRAGVAGYFGLGGDSADEEIDDPILKRVCG